MGGSSILLISGSYLQFETNNVYNNALIVAIRCGEEYKGDALRLMTLIGNRSDPGAVPGTSTSFPLAPGARYGGHFGGELGSTGGGWSSEATKLDRCER